MFSDWYNNGPQAMWCNWLFEGRLKCYTIDRETQQKMIFNGNGDPSLFTESRGINAYHKTHAAKHAVSACK